MAPPARQVLPKAYRDPADTSHSLPSPTPGGAALPYFTQAGAPYGISGNYLARTKQIESGSGSGAGAISSSGAQGPFQFIPSTWAKYGNGGNPNDFGASTAAAVRLAADNKAALTRSLGRAPTDAELYLAHQQGSGGATALLKNPDGRAGTVLFSTGAYKTQAQADAAIKGNGGNPDGPASAFVAMWRNKFNGIKGSTGPLPTFVTGFGGTPYAGGPPPSDALPPILSEGVPNIASPAQPPAAAPTLLEQMPAATPAASPQAPAPVADDEQSRDPKADVYARIEASSASPEVKAHAFAAANQYFQEQKVAQEQDERSEKARSEQANNRYTQRALNGDLSAQILQQVANDPNLLPETKWTLTRAIREESARQGGDDKEVKAYGPGFYGALKGITAPEGDPGRITDDNEILRRAGPGGDLTLSGAEKLISAKHSAERSVNDAAVTRTKSGLLDYAKGQLSFDQETVVPGFPGLKDPKGAALFDSEFIPKFESAYDQWVKDGKDPWQFLTRKNVDEMVKGMRSPSAMAADRIVALGEVGAPTAKPAAGAPQPAPATPAATVPERLPAPPEGYNPAGWARVVGAPPAEPNGRAFPVQQWNQAIRMLADNPTPEMIAKWNASKFGRSGYDALTILRQVRPGAIPTPTAAAPATPAVVAPAPVAAPPPAADDTPALGPM